jgi:DNA polymerase-3 subunit delta'
VAHISDGRPGYAIRLFEQPRLFEARQACLDDLVRMLSSSKRERFAFAREMADDKDQLRGQLQVWMTFWRDVLIRTAGIDESITNLDFSTQIEKLAGSMNMSQAQFQVGAIEQTIDRIDRNVNARLALEVMLMDFPRNDISG